MKKPLTKSAVREAMVSLIDRHDETTNLDIKTQLRNLGYYAVQAEVSKFSDEIYTDGEVSDLAYSTNGSYRTYYIQDDSDTSDDEDDSGVMSRLLNSNSASPLDEEEEEDEEEEDEEEGSSPLKFYIKKKTRPKVFHDYIAFHKNSPGVSVTYDNVTRDQARYAFAKQYGLEYLDIRAHVRRG